MILETWRVQALGSAPVTIYPDGCRDVIWWQARGQAPQWRLAPLDLTARRLQGLAGAQMQGFRLRPGAVVSQDLLRVLKPDAPDAGEAIAALAAVPADLAEVFAAIVELGPLDVAGLARGLGVSARSLQRLTRAATGQGPLYWLRLARLRRAFGLGQQAMPLAHIAHEAGFADQAHFTREARQFHGATPRQLLANGRALQAILAPGL